MGVLGGLSSGPLKLHTGHLHIQFVQVCPLSSGLQAKAQLPLSRESSPITPLPHSKGPSLEGLPLPKHLEASPDINLQVSVQYPKAHSRHLVALCFPWFQIQLCFLQTQNDFLSSGQHSGGAEESELGPPRII